MFNWLESLHGRFGWLRLFGYISFRAAMAVITAMLFTWLLAPPLIRWLQKLKFGQYIRDEGPASHQSKAGTPTMGGILIIAAVTLAGLAWTSLDNYFFWIVLLTFIALGAVGFADDYLKITRKRNLGLAARQKFALQCLIGLGAGGALMALARMNLFKTDLVVPFFKQWYPELGWWYLPFAMLVVVGASNAVNLTDGLDGLATGTSAIAAITYAAIAYLSGNVNHAHYLGIAHVPAAGELTVFLAALVGGCLGFLWYNAYPALVFMGDVGALALGGAIGVVALVTKHELLLVIIGGVFVIEALSVMLQVGFYKWKGKRIFLMAPIHHHFEKKWGHEVRVTTRFWIIAVIFALLGLATLKVR
jgi:phospho-N-acetylmuramoyl-pentapeptide-transferase